MCVRTPVAAVGLGLGPTKGKPAFLRNAGFLVWKRRGSRRGKHDLRLTAIVRPPPTLGKAYLTRAHGAAFRARSCYLI